MSLQHFDKVSKAVDYSLAGGTVTTLLMVWVQWLTPAVAFAAAVFGALAGFYRWRISRLELKMKQEAADEAEKD